MQPFLYKVYKLFAISQIFFHAEVNRDFGYSFKQTKNIQQKLTVTVLNHALLAYYRGIVKYLRKVRIVEPEK
jgi:hypothetical protein